MPEVASDLERKTESDFDVCSPELGPVSWRAHIAETDGARGTVQNRIVELFRKILPLKNVMQLG